MRQILLALFGRELALSLRAGGTGLMTLAFFAMTLTLVPLGLGPEPALLGRVAPGLIWIAAALAALLSLERIFQGDEEDGSLDLLWTAPCGPLALVLVKAAAQWCAAGVPIVVFAPVFAVVFNLAPPTQAILTLTLLIGTPAFYLIGTMAAALTLGVRRGGLLLALIVLPLYVPVIVFGVGAGEAAATGMDPSASLLFLGAVTLLSLVVAPIAAVAALRLHQE